MERVLVRDILSGGFEGREVQVRGWVYRLRRLGGKIFIVVRDGSGGVIQCVMDKRKAVEFEGEVERLGIEASVVVEGRVRADSRAPGGFEIVVDRLEVVGESHNFPIKGGEGIDYLLDNRHLWVRSRRLSSVFRIKDTVLSSLRGYYRVNGWWEVTPPILTMSAVEGGATLFPVDFFGKKAYLSQSAQFYLEVMVFSLEKVWSITTSFRAERSRTRRHLYEYTHFEAEAAWYDMKAMMDVVEDTVREVVKRVLDERVEELEFLGRDIGYLEKAVSRGRYPVLTYDEAIEILQGKGVDIGWGDDLGADEERVLTGEFETPFFLIRFPKELKAFYMKEAPDDPRVVLGFDLLAPEGYGEIVGGSEREDDEEKLVSRIKAEGLRVDDYEWYLDLRRYGSVPHSGFGLGVERLVMWIAGLDHIRDTTPFPRFRDRLYP